MRKQLVKIALFCGVMLIALSACQKETTKDVSKEVLVSFPEITLKGEEVIILPVGGTYSEQGAVLKDDITGKETTIQPTASNVDASKAGLYIVEYRAANANGFETLVSRKVAVTSVTGTTNVAGTYLRAATGVNMFIERKAEGVYKVTNPGGAGAGVHTIVYMVETAKDVYSCPQQPTDAGTMAVANISFSATGVVWRVLNAGYGTGLRTFEKQ